MDGKITGAISGGRIPAFLKENRDELVSGRYISVISWTDIIIEISSETVVQGGQGLEGRCGQ